MAKRSNALVLVLVLLVAALAGLAGWQYTRAQEAEQQIGLDASRVLSAVFTQAQDLRVATLSGKALTKSEDDGPIFKSEQITIAPYQANYFLDLKKVGRESYQWSPTNRRMTISIPDIFVEQPSVDMARAQVKQDGIWISRRAGVELARKASMQLAQEATATAKSDENMDKARQSARAAVARYVARPLQVAGFEGVTVDVRFAFEGARDPSQLDRSRPISEVVEDSVGGR